jgi:acyl-CoA dehydrogenase
MREPGISFGEEQALLLETAAEFARKMAEERRVRTLIQAADGLDRSLWAGMSELGWPVLAVSEDNGGSGLSVADAVPIVEALGRHLLPSPLIPSLVAAAAIAANPPPDGPRLLGLLARGGYATLALAEPGRGWEFRHPTATATRSGGHRLTLAGLKTGVPFAIGADAILTSVLLDGRPRLLALRGDHVPANAARREAPLDETQRTFRLDLAEVAADESGLLPEAPDGFDGLLRGATLLLAAEMCGGVAGVLDVTVDYLKTRKQFGRLIGSYQALKHPVVDLYTHYELLRSLVYAAATRFAANDGWRLVRMAKAKASELFPRAGDRAVQFHGGFGFTYDCDAGLYLRRALWSQAQFGDGPYHRRRLAEELLG